MPTRRVIEQVKQIHRLVQEEATCEEIQEQMALETSEFLDTLWECRKFGLKVVETDRPSSPDLEWAELKELQGY